MPNQTRLSFCAKNSGPVFCLGEFKACFAACLDQILKGRAAAKLRLVIE